MPSLWAYTAVGALPTPLDSSHAPCGVHRLGGGVYGRHLVVCVGGREVQPALYSGPYESGEPATGFACTLCRPRACVSLSIPVPTAFFASTFPPHISPPTAATPLPASSSTCSCAPSSSHLPPYYSTYGFSTISRRPRALCRRPFIGPVHVP